ncbi:hypothetical protein AB0R12_13765, partial [Streptomyces niveus]|uniref:ABC transporter permease subunit n=1 Tax=Streptomyces niveus TaxID=193462 RepID=UPI0034858B91
MSLDKTSVGPADDAPATADDAPAPAAGAATVAVDPRLLVREQGFAGYLSEFKRKMRGGDLGSIPVVVGLIIIWAIFASLNSNFLTAGNLSNIAVAMVGTGMIAVGIVFVLLLGEIDLSVGSVSGVAGAAFAVLAVTHGMAEWLALILAILTGTVAGAIHGFFFARVGVPAFAVTLAGLLFWNGFMLQVLGDDGTINLDPDGLVANLTGYYFSDVAAAYGLAVIAVAGYFLSAFFDNRRRAAAGVPSRPLSEIIVRTALLAVLAFAAAIMFNQNKGLPVAAQAADGGGDGAVGGAPAEDQGARTVRVVHHKVRHLDVVDLGLAGADHEVVVGGVVGDVAGAVLLLDAADTVLETRGAGHRPRA